MPLSISVTDMPTPSSLVGPRPALPEEVAGYDDVVRRCAEAGVAVRMALLYLFAGEGAEPPAVEEVD